MERIKLSKDMIDKIVSSYEQFNRNASKAAKNFEVVPKTVIKYWRKAKLKIRGKGRALNDNDIEKIIEAYKKSDGNISEVSEITNYSRNTIYKYLKKECLNSIIENDADDSAK